VTLANPDGGSHPQKLITIADLTLSANTSVVNPTPPVETRFGQAHSVFTGISRNHLDRLVTELAVPFHAGREGRLHRRRGDRDRHRWPGAGHPET
jgi:hypothetical protein